jgi:hypothetical protein
MPKPIKPQSKAFFLSARRTFHTTASGRREQMTSVSIE